MCRHFRCKSPMFLSSTAYCASSVFMILGNKTLLSSYQFQHFILLMFIQNILGLAYLMLFAKVGLLDLSIKLDFEKIQKWVPVNVLFVLMLYTGNGSLHGLPVPLVTVFKNSTNILIAAGDFLFFQSRTSTLGMLSFLLTLGTTFYVASGDIATYNRIDGYIYMSLNCLMTAAYVLYLRHVLMTITISKAEAAFYNNMLAVPLNFVILIANGNIREQLQHGAFSQTVFLVLLFLTGLGGVLLNMSSMWCMRETSATTYCVIGAGNKVVLVLLGMALFSDGKMTYDQGLFVFVGVLAGLLYGYSKLGDQRVEVTLVATESKGKKITTACSELGKSHTNGNLSKSA